MGTLRRAPPEVPRYAGCGHLNEVAPGHKRNQRGRIFLDLGVPFRVRDDRRDAHELKRETNIHHARRDDVGDQFQHEVPAAVADGHTPARSNNLGQFGEGMNVCTRQNGEADRRPGKRPPESPYALEDLLASDVVHSVEHVGCGDYCCRAVVHGQAAHFNGLGHVFRSVIEAGQDMSVQVNHNILKSEG